MNTSSPINDNTKTEAPKQQEQPNLHAEKSRRELWMYLGVGILSIDLLVTVACVCYAFITASPNAQGVRSISFPLLQWVAGIITLPALLVAAIHFTGVGLFTQSKANKQAEEQWEDQLPKRLQKVYLFLKGAPVFVIILTFILIGGTLATIDGALTALSNVTATFVPYLPYILGAFALIVCCFFIVSAWLKHSAHKLQEEYAFRREVFERSGIIIVEKNSVALPPTQGTEAYPRALEATTTGVKALPQAGNNKDDDVIDAEVTDIDQPPQHP